MPAEDSDSGGRAHSGGGAVRPGLPDPCGRRASLHAPRSTAPLLAAVADRVVERVPARVQHEIRAYAGPPHGRRRQLIREAVERAVADFLDLVAGRPGDHLAVDMLFRRMGYGLAVEGRRPTHIAAAFQVAARDVWRALEVLTSRHDLPGRAVAAIASAVTGYLQHLSEQVERGYRAARAAAQNPRTQLLRALLAGQQAPVLEGLAAAASWPLPARAVVLVADVAGGLVRPEVADIHDRALAAVEGDRLVVVTTEADAESVRAAALRALPGIPVAVTWPVPLETVPNAQRWARRALALRREGRIGDGRLAIDCAEHRMALWLEADPPLARQLSSELLAPLLLEKPHQRKVLAETLLRWLETNEPAAALAVHLGTHAQTVRNRIHRLRLLFGDALTDADRRMALILALETMLPEWRVTTRR